MRASNWLLAPCFAVLGCADMAPLPAGVCGNGVVDPAHEDCDSRAPGKLSCGGPSEQGKACRFKCNSTENCPAGWACAHGACVFASGSFAGADGTTTSATLDVWTLGDVDRDGVLDLAGMHGRQLEVRYGDGSGAFGESHGRPLDPRGDPWFGDADGDGFLEAAVPTPAGVVLLRGDRARVGFLPLSYVPSGYVDDRSGLTESWAALLGMPPGYQRPPSSPYDDWKAECDGLLLLQARRDGGLTGTTHVVPLAQGTDATLTGAFRALPSCRSESGGAAACADVRVVRLERPASAPASEGSSALIAPAFADHALVATIGIEESEPTVVATRPLPLPAGLTIAAKAGTFAAKTSVPDELVFFIPARDENQHRHLLRGSRGANGKLGALSVDWRFEPKQPCSGSDELGVLPLAAADLDGDGQLDFVMPHGLCRGGDDSTPLELVTDPSAAWQEAAVADFDDDGTLDVAGLRSDALGIDVVYRDGNWGYSLAGLATGPEPRLLSAAQLDGLGGWDLVFADKADDSLEHVEVAFGDDVGMTPPEPVGLVAGLTRIESGIARDQLGHCDNAMDLALTVGTPSGSAVVPLYGSADRAIYAPAVLARKSVAEVPLAAVLGKLGAPGRAWMMASAEARDGTGSQYGVPDVLAGGLVAAEYARVDAVTCGGGRPNFIWVMADANGDGTDEAIGVVGTDDCQVASTAATSRVAVVSPSLRLVLHEAPISSGVVNELLAADLDQDDLLDLVLARADGLFVLWGARDDAPGRDKVTWTTAPLKVGDALQLGDAPPVRSMTLLDADARPGKELSFLTDDSIVVVAFEGQSVRELARLSAPAGATQLRSGDVDADGVDDLAVSDAQRVHTFLGLPHRSVAH